MKSMRTALLAGLALTALATGPADAERYRRDNWFWNYNDGRYCLSSIPGGGVADCAYPTYQSCMASASGLGGAICSVNLRYVERSDAPPRPRKRVRRVHP